MEDRRWIILLVLFIARTSLAFQVQSVTSISTFLINDLQLGLSEIGTLVGLIMLPGIFIALPSGFIGHWYSGKQFVLTGLILMVLGGFVSTVADSYAWMVVARIISGIGVVLNIVYMAKMTTDWFAGKEIATAMSVLVTSWPLGFALGQVFQPEMAAHWGWRVVPLSTSIICLACAALIWQAYREPDSTGGAETPTQVRNLSLKSVVLVSLSGLIWMALNVGYLIYLSFTPTILMEGGENIVVANQITSVGSWMMLLSIPMFGWLADRTRRPDLLLFAGTLMAIASLALLPGTQYPKLLCLVFGLLGVAPAGIVMSLPAQVLAPNERAIAMGIFYTFYYAGMTLGPSIAGTLADYYTSSNAAMYFAAALFLVLALCHFAFRVIQLTLPKEAL
ncbi:MAG: MFS transporter [Gammaproteobacteria bacterium]|nr:MFS transporter [Gammaproteobacteria bacterium]